MNEGIVIKKPRGFCCCPYCRYVTDDHPVDIIMHMNSEHDDKGNWKMERVKAEDGVYVIAASQV